MHLSLNYICSYLFICTTSHSFFGGEIFYCKVQKSMHLCNALKKEEKVVKYISAIRARAMRCCLFKTFLTCTACFIDNSMDTLSYNHCKHFQPNFHEKFWDPVCLDCCHTLQNYLYCFLDNNLEKSQVREKICENEVWFNNPHTVSRHSKLHT